MFDRHATRALENEKPGRLMALGVWLSKCTGEAGGDGKEGEDMYDDLGDGSAEAVARNFESGEPAGGEEHQLQRPELP